MNFLKLNRVPILEQLQIEEALLRANNENWCLLNEGSSDAIVMGISGKPEQLINIEMLRETPVPLIKRFSGGGTVFVNTDTIFVTFICNSDSVNVPCFPKHILNWTEEIYRSVFPGFILKENDYAFSDKKFGGNAQYIQKGRWLHHSTLLWDFNPEQMRYLKMPPRMPEYRNQRDHNEFLCRLKDYVSDQKEIETNLLNSLSKHFTLKQKRLEEVKGVLNIPHRKATTIEL